MKELSLNILDITKNSVSAGAKNIDISLVTDTDGWLRVTVSDDGCGMDEQTLLRVSDPFYTTRTTRRVGMGIPLFKMAAEATGGCFSLTSSTAQNDHGTEISATFDTSSIDFMPVGDIISTVCVLIMGSPDIDFCFSDVTPFRAVRLNTKEMRQVLGDGISLASSEVIEWIREYLTEQYQ